MYNTKKLTVAAITTSLAVGLFGLVCLADTFIHRHTSETIHGYATNQVTDNKTTVCTKEKEQVQLNLADWKIVSDNQGRNNKVIVIKLDDQITSQIESDAAKKAITESANEGPLFILLEIDTPGGRTDLTNEICGTITATKYCLVIAFISGGKYGGAISAGSAVALACNKIYMASNTIIGAATAITITEKGPQDLKTAFGSEVGEKISSAWQAYLASLAEQNNRPGILARAMVDKEIEVIEVTRDNKRLFIEPINKKQQDTVIHTWSNKDSLLTLTAAEAVKCGIADKVVETRSELLADAGAIDAEIIVNKAIQDARKELERAKERLEKIRKSTDLKIKELSACHYRHQGLKLLREIRTNFKYAIDLAKRYPDLGLAPQPLQDELNSIEAAYQNAKSYR